MQPVIRASQPQGDHQGSRSSGQPAPADHLAIIRAATGRPACINAIPRFLPVIPVHDAANASRKEIKNAGKDIVFPRFSAIPGF